MLVKELIEILQQMPPDMPVMLPAEAGVDQPQSVYIAKVTKTRRNWSGTPVGNFRVLNEHMSEEIDGDAFDAAIIDLNEVYENDTQNCFVL